MQSDPLWVILTNLQAEGFLMANGKMLNLISAYYLNLIKLLKTAYIGCVKFKIKTYTLTFNS